MSVLEIKAVSKQFASGGTTIDALKPTNFQIEQGEFVAIVGPSGSGKSTLLTILGALQTPSSGEVFLNGKSLEKLNEKQRANIRYHEIGFILQTSNLIQFLTVNDQFRLIDRLNKENREADRNDLMEKLGIKELSNKHINELSGGQKQRVAIARALYNNPTLILADEPTASLDSKKAFEVVSLLAKETKEKKKATIMVTHDIRMVSLCDKVYKMEDGVLTQVHDVKE